MTPYAETRYPLRVSIGAGRIHAAARTGATLTAACGQRLDPERTTPHGIGPTCRDCKRQ